MPLLSLVPRVCVTPTPGVTPCPRVGGVHRGNGAGGPTLWRAGAGQYTQTGVPMGTTLFAQIQSMAATLTRTHPWEAG